MPTGRTVGSRGHGKARQILRRRLREAGCEPWRGGDFEMPSETDGESFCNLAGVVRGRDPHLTPLLVGAHYDSAIEAPCGVGPPPSHRQSALAQARRAAPGVSGS